MKGHAIVPDVVDVAPAGTIDVLRIRSSFTVCIKYIIPLGRVR